METFIDAADALYCNGIERSGDGLYFVTNPDGPLDGVGLTFEEALTRWRELWEVAWQERRANILRAVSRRCGIAPERFGSDLDALERYLKDSTSNALDDLREFDESDRRDRDRLETVARERYFRRFEVFHSGSWPDPFEDEGK